MQILEFKADLLFKEKNIYFYVIYSSIKVN